MDTFLIIAAIALGVFGIIGSIIPGIPGPPLSWVGLALLYAGQGMGVTDKVMGLPFLLTWLAVTVVVCVLDYVVPALFTKMTGGSKYASWGAIIGLFIGLIHPPIGMIFGSLLFAFLFDFFLGDKGVWGSFKSSIGAFLGFIFGTGLKLVASAVMMYYIISYI